MAFLRLLAGLLATCFLAPSAGERVADLDAELGVDMGAGENAAWSAETSEAEAPIELVSMSGKSEKVMVKLSGGRIATTGVQDTIVALLKNEALLEDNVTSCSCGKLPPKPSKTQTCGMRWYKDDVLLPCPLDGSIAAGASDTLKIIYEISSEALLGAGLVDFIRKLPGLDSKQRGKVAASLRKEGITSREGLRSVNIPEVLKSAEVSKEAEPVVQQELAKEASKQTAEAQKDDATTTTKPSIKAEDMEKKAAAVKTEAAQLAKELGDAVDKATSEGSKNIGTEVASNLKAVQTSMESLKGLATDAEAFAKAGSTAMSTYDESGSKSAVIGSAETHKWNTQKLIDRNGVLRGTTLLVDLESTGMAQVVQLAEKLEALDDAALEAQVALQPDIQTAETTITSTSSSTMSKANRVIESSGYSSFRARKDSIGAGLAFTGGPVTLSVGFQDNDASSSGSAEDSGNTETEQLAEMTHTLLKTRYFFEPREEIRIPPTVLQATPEFKQAAQAVARSDKVGKTGAIWALFRRFGTHVCPHVMLGGWWRIDAKYSSAKKQRGVDMSRATSLAMEEAASNSFSVGVKVAAGGTVGGGVDFSTGNAKSNKDTEKKGSGSRLLGRYADEESVLDIQQQWKGGMSGGSPATWRESLDMETNAYWKVIDRYETECVGVWMFAPEGAMQEICETWKAVFLERLSEHLTDAEKGELFLKGCDTGNMNPARQAALSYMRQKAFLAQQEADAKCTKLPGRWWGSKGTGAEPACHLNQCKCGSDPGAQGEDCPKNGAEKCQDDQLGLCTSMACGAKKLPVPGAGSKRCAKQMCGKADEELCCRSAGIGRMFDVRIKFNEVLAMGLEGGSELRVLLKNAKTGTSWMLWGDHADHGVEITRTVTSNVGELEPTRICILNRFLHHPLDYFMMDSVKIKNHDAPDATAYWTEIGDWGGALHPRKHACRDLKMR